MLPSAVCATLLLATAVPAAGSEGEQVYDRLVRSTTLILGQESLGSGVLVHRARRLVLTNDHVVEESPGKVYVAFALYDGSGQLVSDFKQYAHSTRQLRTAARGELPAHVRKADVLARKPGKDLALLQLDGVPDSARSLRLAAKPAPTGSQVFTIGNSGAGGSNLLWRYTTGNVRGRSTQQVKLHGGSQTKALNSLVMETDAAINPGDSGGPVVNGQCQLVAVNCFGNTGSRLVSGHIDVEEIRKFLRAEVPDIDWP